MQGGSDYFDPMSGRLRQVSLTTGSGQTDANNQGQSVTLGRPHFSTLQYKDSDYIHPLNQSGHDSLALNLGYSHILKIPRPDPYLKHQNVGYSHTLNRPSKRQLGNKAWTKSQTLMRPSQGLMAPWMMFKGGFGTCSNEQNPVNGVYRNVSSNKTEPQKLGMQFQEEAEAARMNCLYGNGDGRMNTATVALNPVNCLYEDDGQIGADRQGPSMEHQEEAALTGMDCLDGEGDGRFNFGSSDQNPVNGLNDDGHIGAAVQSSWMMNEEGVNTGSDQVNPVHADCIYSNKGVELDCIYGNEGADLSRDNDSRIYGNM